MKLKVAYLGFLFGNAGNALVFRSGNNALFV